MPNKKMTVADMEMITREYQDLKDLIDKYTIRLNSLKKELSDQVDEFGSEDEKGNKWLPLGNFQLKRERRASVSFDTKTAEVWAKGKGLWADVVETIEVVSEDKVLSLGWRDAELKKDIDSMYTTKESWAFKILDSAPFGDE
jgi:hypothetical protein